MQQPPAPLALLCGLYVILVEQVLFFHAHQAFLALVLFFALWAFTLDMFFNESRELCHFRNERAIAKHPHLIQINKAIEEHQVLLSRMTVHQGEPQVAVHGVKQFVQATPF
jgi:hypothetical protein